MTGNNYHPVDDHPQSLREAIEGRPRPEPPDEPCEVCDGDGSCPECFGSNPECDVCEGEGVCSFCQGEG